MSYVKVEQAKEPIVGFWNRKKDTSITGVVKAVVKTDVGIYWLFRVYEDCECLDKSDGKIVAHKGDIVGVSNSVAIDSKLESLVRRPGLVRITSHGKDKSLSGKTIWKMDVEYDADARPNFPGEQTKMRTEVSSPSDEKGSSEKIPF